MIAMQMKWEGVTPDQYHQLNTTMNTQDEPPAGLLLHVAFSDGNNLRVQDVWESNEHLNEFTEKRIMPAVSKLGITTQPQMEVYPVLGLQTPGFVPNSEIEMDEEEAMVEEEETA